MQINLEKVLKLHKVVYMERKERDWYSITLLAAKGQKYFDWGKDQCFYKIYSSCCLLQDEMLEVDFVRKATLEDLLRVPFELLIQGKPIIRAVLNANGLSRNLQKRDSTGRFTNAI